VATGRLDDTYGGYRSRLVDALRQKGISDMAVLAAVGRVPRHLFVPEALRARAYEDAALPIGNGQTISQPSTHAAYLAALQLQGSERVLEVGTGSGYQTALLSFLAEHVMSVERIPSLARAAAAALDLAGCANVAVAVGDGTLGWSPMAPYDAILVGAAGPEVPGPLLRQLAEGGRLVMPVAGETRQVLVRITKRGNTLEQDELGLARFVPLVGRHGFAADGKDSA
jgi:protein-L-isoaspartate(D-aspartate) O-methyltransferase